MTNFYNRYCHACTVKEKSSKDFQFEVESIAMADIVGYISEFEHAVCYRYGNYVSE